MANELLGWPFCLSDEQMVAIGWGWFAPASYEQFVSWFTLPETNVAPENRPSQKETSIPTIHFQGLC